MVIHSSSDMWRKMYKKKRFTQQQGTYMLSFSHSFGQDFYWLNRVLSRLGRTTIFLIPDSGSPVSVLTAPETSPNIWQLRFRHKVGKNFTNDIQIKLKLPWKQAIANL